MDAEDQKQRKRKENDVQVIQSRRVMPGNNSLILIRLNKLSPQGLSQIKTMIDETKPVNKWISINECRQGLLNSCKVHSYVKR